MKLMPWYCDWIVLEEYFHLLNCVILNTECIFTSVVDKCVQYCFCLYRDKKMFILWKVLWKKYYSSVPSMHQMEFIIHWTWRKNRITLLKLMKLEGKDLEVKQETCVPHTHTHTHYVSYNTHVISSVTVQVVQCSQYQSMPLVIILRQFYPPATFTFPKHPYELFIVCVTRTYIILCLSASRSIPVLIGGFSKKKVFVLQCKVHAINRK